MDPAHEKNELIIISLSQLFRLIELGAVIHLLRFSVQIFYTRNEGASLQVIADVWSRIQSYKLDVFSKLFSKSVAPEK
jgi:hypothetical protein